MSVKDWDYPAFCHVCRKKFWFSELLKRWDGVYVDKSCWEPFHDGDRAPQFSDEETITEGESRTINNDSNQYVPITADTAEQGLWYNKTTS